MKARIALAVVIGSMVGVIAHMLAFTIASSFYGNLQPISAREAGVGLLLFFLVGLPPALAITAGMAVPLFHVLRQRKMLNNRNVALIGTVAGAFIVPLIWRTVWGNIEGSILVWGLIGSGVGFATSETFWVVVRQRLPRE